MTKATVLTLIVAAFGTGMFFSGCEKTDYQNPFHRAGQNK